MFAMNFLFFMLFLKATTTLCGLPAGSFMPSKISQSLGTVMLKSEALYITLFGFVEVVVPVIEVSVSDENKEHPVKDKMARLVIIIFDNFVMFFCQEIMFCEMLAQLLDFVKNMYILCICYPKREINENRNSFFSG